MEVGPCRHVPGYPARIQGGVGTELHGPLRGFLLVPGDTAGPGDPISAGQGVDAGAEVRSGLRVEAGGQAYAHAGFQGDGLAGGDDVRAGNP